MQKSWLALGLLWATACNPAIGGGDGGAHELGVNHDLGGDLAGVLTIAPLNAVVTATSATPKPTVQYMAQWSGASVAPAWTIDRGEIGTIDVSSGLFTAGGTIAGTAHVSARYQGLVASTSVT